ncbi:MAG: hypothetical protein D6737_11945 [Chloroflexi bacterium]|nr:MAG: hypothetical protein D6737_11945 [Chloroflexota bacterium]
MSVSFYDPQRVGDLYTPNITKAVEEGLAADIAPSSTDTYRILFILVDAQVDFIHPTGTLAVPDAIFDLRRTIEWVLQHIGDITTIAASLDSHIPIQIFYPTWWVDSDGNHPQAYTVITHEDVQSGKWQPIFEPEWSVEYVQRLQQHAKKTLMIWPYHTMIGSTGHNLMPAVYETIVYHSAARRAHPMMITKGLIAKSEFYSLLEPEIKVPDEPDGSLNLDVIRLIEHHDAVYIAGQAKSHCVLETVTSIMNYFNDQPEQISKLHILTDCTSSVAHPEIDFDALADETFADFAKRGLKLITSADPLDKG